MKEMKRNRNVPSLFFFFPFFIVFLHPSHILFLFFVSFHIFLFPSSFSFYKLTSTTLPINRQTHKQRKDTKHKRKTSSLNPFPTNQVTHKTFLRFLFSGPNFPLPGLPSTLITKEINQLRETMDHKLGHSLAASSLVPQQREDKQ